MPKLNIKSEFTVRNARIARLVLLSLGEIFFTFHLACTVHHDVPVRCKKKTQGSTPPRVIVSWCYSLFSVACKLDPALKRASCTCVYVFVSVNVGILYALVRVSRVCALSL